MLGNYTYPGVYIEEVPSGVRTITGVSLSETAFIDVFKRGFVNEATRITSFPDFERKFGGLDARSEASYAIQQFYLNGGQIAWVVRVAPGNPGTSSLDLLGSSPPQATLKVQAANPGSWGDSLQVAVTSEPPHHVFNLFVRETATVGSRLQVLSSESYRNLNMDKASQNYAPAVINASGASQLVHLTDVGIGVFPNFVLPYGSGLPPETAYQSLSGGNDGSFIDPITKNFIDPLDFANQIADPGKSKGMYSLDRIAPFIFNILCIPAAAKLSMPYLKQVIDAATAYCEEKRAFFIVDIAPDVDEPNIMATWVVDNNITISKNAAVYFPRLEIVDVLNGQMRNVGASGTLAGVYARIDATRGIWKAPAGTEATLRGANVTAKLTDLENGTLNPLGINVLRMFPIFGNVSWGARTLEGSNQNPSEWKYIPVRRMALFLEESLYQGLKWVVFEPNDEPLWASIRLNVGAFLQNLFRQGAFQGRTPREAYFVKCDRETTTQTDINDGIVNIVVGFAALKPVEFVVVKIQQMAGQIPT
jgi:phage tail sheath protein FI